MLVDNRPAQEFTRLTSAIHQCCMARDQMLRDSRAPLCMTVAEQNLVLHLANVGPSHMSDVAADLRISPQGMSRIVSALEDRDLVYRVMDPNNRRMRVLHLTDKARAMVDGHLGDALRSTRMEFFRYSPEQREAITQFIESLGTKPRLP